MVYLSGTVRWRFVLVIFVIAITFYTKLTLARQYTFLETFDAIRHGQIALWSSYEWMGLPLPGAKCNRGETARPTLLAPLQQARDLIDFLSRWPEQCSRLKLRSGRRGGGTGDAGAAGDLPERRSRSYTRFGLNTVSVDVALGCRGMLLVSDNWFAGWVGAVDGRSASIERADSAIRGMIVEAGRHTVTMKYRPWTALGGLALLLMGVGQQPALTDGAEKCAFVPGSGILRVPS